MERIKTLYLSDLDGTLLGSDSRISAESSAIISDLSRRGAMISVATARTPATVTELLRGTVTNVPAIVMTGAGMWDRRRDCFGQAHFVPSGHVETVLGQCADHGVHPFVYCLDGDNRHLEVYHAARTMNRAEESFYLQRRHLALKRFHIGTPVPPERLATVMLFFATGPMEVMKHLADSLRAMTDCCINCYPDIFNTSTGILEILAPGVSKASAALRLKEHTGADRLVAFGDNLNDLPMLAAADVAVAVGNAFEPVKQGADIVIGPNYADAVAHFILNDFENR